MKSPIESPIEVVAPTVQHALKHKSYNIMDKAIVFHSGVGLDSDSETDQTTSSTITDSASEDDGSDSVGSVSDCNEDDLRTSLAVDGGAAVSPKDDGTTSSSSSNTRERRSVSFGPIHVRQYERIVGDHPDTRVGVPLSIGWSYSEDDSVSIERYEADRIRKGKIRMSSITRKNMLLNVFGLPEKEIIQAEQRSKKLQKQRQRRSVQSEPTLKNFGRKLRKRGISILKGVSNAQIGGFRGASGFSSAVEQMF